MNRFHKKYECPCCGYLTLSSKAPGTFEICPVCFWEDDNVQYENTDYSGGANVVSLFEAKNNFKKIGAISEEFLKEVRKPHLDEIPQGLID